MVQIVLIRPGTTDYDQQGRIQGTLDIPLNAQGTDEVRRIIEGIRTMELATIYCAPCQSAEQTATAISEALDVKLKKLDTLSNIDHGLWQGMLVEDVKRKQPKVFRQWQEQPATICPPEGEMLSGAQERVQAAVTKILKKHKQGAVALVVPEPLASVIQSYLSQGEIGDFWKHGDVCGKWDVLSIEPHTLVPSES